MNEKLKAIKGYAKDKMFSNEELIDLQHAIIDAALEDYAVRYATEVNNEILMRRINLLNKIIKLLGWKDMNLIEKVNDKYKMMCEWEEKGMKDTDKEIKTSKGVWVESSACSADFMQELKTLPKNPKNAVLVNYKGKIYRFLEGKE